MLHYQFAELVAVVVDDLVLQPKDTFYDFIGVGVSTETFWEGVAFQLIFRVGEEQLSHFAHKRVEFFMQIVLLQRFVNADYQFIVNVVA